MGAVFLSRDSELIAECENTDYGEEIMEYCLNLCDIFTALFREYGDVGSLISAAEDAKKIKYNRICLGSYFCDNYFIQNIQSMILNVYPYCRKNNIRITLTLPVFSETFLNKGIKLSDELLSRYNNIIDEVTVNDVGMLQYVSGRKSVNINQGRLLQKYSRDIRYADYSKGRFRYYGYADEYESLAETIEFDVCAETMEIHIGRKRAAIHRNYSYATMGRICQFAGLNRGVWEKFDLSIPCGEICSQFFLNYVDQDGHTFCQVGKAVFSELSVNTIETDSEIRFVDFPLYLWKSKYPLSDFNKS